MRNVKFMCPVDDETGDSAHVMSRNPTHEAEDAQRVVFQRMAPKAHRLVSRQALNALAVRYPDCFVCVLPAGWRIEVAGEPQPEEYKEGVCVPATTSG